MNEVTEFLNVMYGAKKTVQLNVKPGEDVLIVTTPEGYGLLTQAFAAAARDVGAGNVMVAIYAQPPTLTSPQGLIEAAKKAKVLFTVNFPSWTPMAHEAIKAGARLVTIGGPSEQFYQGAVEANYDEVYKVTKQLADILSKGKQAQVKTTLGTDLKFKIGRKCMVVAGIACEENGWDTGGAIDGEAMLAPMEGTAEGTLVIDVSILCYDEYGTNIIGLVKDPVKLTFKQGNLTDINGGTEAKVLADVLERLEAKGDKGAKLLGEFGVGTNPKARFVGTHQDKKRLGTAHFALGDNKTFGGGDPRYAGKVASDIHYDMTVKNVEIIIDGKTIIKNNEFLFLK
jgi:leucyl aminopeptidase (aminopeptidase T)